MTETALSAKQDISGMTAYTTSSDVESYVSGYTYDKATIDSKVASGGTFDPTNYYDKTATDALLDNKFDASAFTSYSAATDARMSEDEEVTAAALNDLNDALSGKADSTAVTQDIAAATSGLQETLVSTVNIKTINNESILGSGNITISGGSGGSNVVEVTQAEYDALVSAGTVAADTFYIITDATEINLSGYAQTSAVTAEITAAVSGKVETSAITSAITSSSTNSQVPSAKAVYDQLGGSSITVDTALDSGSTNPVENRVIYGKFDEVEQVTAAALNALNDRVDAIDITVDDALDATSENPVQNKVIYAVIGDIESLLSNI